MTPKPFDELKLAVGDIVVSPVWADGQQREGPPRYEVESVERRLLKKLDKWGLTYSVPDGDGKGIDALYYKA